MAMPLFAALCLASSAAATYLTPLRDEADLKTISTCLGCWYILLANITVSSAWAPIGSTTNPFTGTLDGQGNTITFTGLKVSPDNVAGLFGVLTNARIFNLRLVSTVPLGIPAETTDLTLGLLAGSDKNSTVYGCSAILTGTVSMTTGTLIVGGLLGTASNSTLSADFASVSLTGIAVPTLTFGGLVGDITNSSIFRCEVSVASSVRTATTAHTGGMLGACRSTSVVGSSVAGSLSSQASSTAEHVGGIVGSLMDDPTDKAYSSSIKSVVANVTITCEATSSFFAGGIVGKSNGIAEILELNVIFRVVSKSKDSAIGGAVGAAVGNSVTIRGCFVNATITASPAPEASVGSYIGGLLGSLSVTTSRIDNSAAIVAISVDVPAAIVGGLIGHGSNAMVEDSGAGGVIKVTVTSSGDTFAGGIVGNVIETQLSKCYFLGNLLASGKHTSSMGGLIATMSKSSIDSSYALVNITSSTPIVSCGGVARMTESSITSTYVAVNVSTTQSTHLAIGGMVAVFDNANAINDSFVLCQVLASGSATVAAIGGFIGYSAFGKGKSSVLGCYSWGSLTVELANVNTVNLGGLLGEVTSSLNVSMCIAYTNISSPNDKATAGLLAGIAYQPTSSFPVGTLSNLIAFVAPSGGLANTKIIGTTSRFKVTKCFCAAYPGTVGCEQLAVLNTQFYLNKLDFDFCQLNQSVANGSISLRILPLPLTGATIGSPKLVIPDARYIDHWPHDYWVVGEAMQSGFPYLRLADYASYCGPYIGCHGTGLSPVDAKCSAGWRSPQRNTTAMVDNLSRCSLFECTLNSECRSHGTCTSGTCVCDRGYGGPDCSVQYCESPSMDPCDSGECVRFTATSSRGACTCKRSDVFSLTALCIPGCESVGYGVCMENSEVACFEGYTEASKCFSYDCSAVTSNKCNGKGTCTESKCTCAEGNVLLDSNCYKPCPPTATADCTTVTCGSENACSSKGLCMPSLAGNSFSCICNVDASGNPTGEHLGGPLCNECENGYVVHEGSCVQDKCSKCDGGTCKFDPTSGVMVCTCPEDKTLQDGVCVDSRCGHCPVGSCNVIPNSRDPDTLYCTCNAGVSDQSCYTLSCPSCTGGFCTPDSTRMVVECVCPGGSLFSPQSGACEAQKLSSKNLTIILCVVIIGGSAVIAAVVAGVILSRRRASGFRGIPRS